MYVHVIYLTFSSSGLNDGGLLKQPCKTQRVIVCINPHTRLVSKPVQIEQCKHNMSEGISLGMCFICLLFSANVVYDVNKAATLWLHLELCLLFTLCVSPNIITFCLLQGCKLILVTQ